MTDKFCTKCGAKMEITIEDCSSIGRYVWGEGIVQSTGKKYRRDTGEEIMVRKWSCPNRFRRTKYNWLFRFMTGAPKFEDHDVKAEYINHDNPNAIIL